jgi:hypothetical protein
VCAAVVSVVVFVAVLFGCNYGVGDGAGCGSENGGSGGPCLVFKHASPTNAPMSLAQQRHTTPEGYSVVVLNATDLPSPDDGHTQ